MFTRPRAGVAEWQTRRTQNPLPAMACGFDSHLRHSCKRGVCERDGAASEELNRTSARRSARRRSFFVSASARSDSPSHLTPWSSQRPLVAAMRGGFSPHPYTVPPLSGGERGGAAGPCMAEVFPRPAARNLPALSPEPRQRPTSVSVAGRRRGKDRCHRQGTKHIKGPRRDAGGCIPRSRGHRGPTRTRSTPEPPASP